MMCGCEQGKPASSPGCGVNWGEQMHACCAVCPASAGYEVAQMMGAVASITQQWLVQIPEWAACFTCLNEPLLFIYVLLG